MVLPVVELSGSPLEQGKQHGEALRPRIAHNVALYFDRFHREGKLVRAEVLERAAQYASAIEQQDPEYAEAMRGVALASGFSYHEVVALNVRYEILYHQFGKIALAGKVEPLHDGCTAYAVQPEVTQDGRLLMGQNWDWIPQVKGAVLRQIHPDGLKSLGYTEAGIVGPKLGLNSAGIGLAINGITTVEDDWSRLRRPHHVRCYEVLRSRTFEEALGAVSDEPRSCSTNYVIAQAPDRIVDVEAAPDSVLLLDCQGGCVVHTNHFVDAAAAGVVEPPLERRPHSEARLDRMRELIGSNVPCVTPEALLSHMRDHAGHPYGICRHPDLEEVEEERYETVTSALMDLTAGTLLISDGPPCVNEYARLSL